MINPIWSLKVGFTERKIRLKKIFEILLITDFFKENSRKQKSSKVLSTPLIADRTYFQFIFK